MLEVININEKRVLKGPEQYTKEWYDLRIFNRDREIPVVIGASEGAAAMGLSSYSSPCQLYLEKTGEIPAEEFTDEQRERVEMGLELEPVILGMYKKKTGVSVFGGLPLMLDDADKFMGASLDALAFKQPELGPDWCVDAKSTTDMMFDRTGQDDSKFGHDGTDQVPLDILIQGQQQMAVTGLGRCDFPVLFNGRHLKIYTVNRDDELIERLRSAERELVERMINSDPPEPTWTHPGTRRLIQERQGVEIGSVVTLPVSYLAMWNRSEELKDVIATAEKERDALRLQLLDASGTAEKVLFEESPLKLKKISVSPKYVTQHDVEAIQAKVGTVGRKGYCFLKSTR